MTDAEFLRWMADRLVHVYGESPNVDFVQHLREIADRVDALNAAERAKLPSAATEYVMGAFERQKERGG